MSFLITLLGIGMPLVYAIALAAAAVLSWLYVARFLPTLGGILTMVFASGALLCVGYSHGFSEAKNACNAAAIQNRLDRTLVELQLAQKAAQVNANSVEQINDLDAQNKVLADEIARLSRKPDEPERIPEPDQPHQPAVPQSPARDVCYGFSRDDVGRLLRIK